MRVQGPQVQLRQRGTVRRRCNGVRHADEPAAGSAWPYQDLLAIGTSGGVS